MDRAELVSPSAKIKLGHVGLRDGDSVIIRNAKPFASHEA